MERNSRIAEVLLALLAVLIVFFGSTNALVQFVSSWFCSPAPAPLTPIAGLDGIFTGNVGDWTVTGNCEVAVTQSRVVLFALVVVLVSVTAWAWLQWQRWKQSTKYFVQDMRRRSGFAQHSEVVSTFGSRATLKRAARLRPTLTNPTLEQVGLRLGEARRQDVWVTIEDSVALLGSPRSGKGLYFLVGMILDYPGPVITTSTRADNLSLTLAGREHLGDVSVFDPQGLAGISRAVKWSPIAGCEDPLRATQRASAIVAGTKLGSSSSNQEWAERSAMILARLLHAAALGSRDAGVLSLWGSNPHLAREAVDILRSHPKAAPGWGEDIDAIINGSPELLSSSWFGVSGATAPLMIPTVREAMMPTSGEAFDVDRFLSGRNTLYLIGTGSGAGAAGGFLGALMDDITEHARRRALRMPGSRLDPPLGLILDEIANIFTWPALPQLMADGGGAGIQPVVVLQALSQAETVWSRAEARTIWNAATVKLILGGAGDSDFLDDVVKLIGTRDVTRKSRSWSDSGKSTSEQSHTEPVISIDELRRIPESLSLMLSRTRRPVFLQSEKWTQRRDAAEISASRARVENQQRFGREGKA